MLTLLKLYEISIITKRLVFSRKLFIYEIIFHLNKTFIRIKYLAFHDLLRLLYLGIIRNCNCIKLNMYHIYDKVCWMKFVFDHWTRGVSSLSFFWWTITPSVIFYRIETQQLFSIGFINKKYIFAGLILTFSTAEKVLLC